MIKRLLRRLGFVKCTRPDGKAYWWHGWNPEAQGSTNRGVISET